MGETESLLSWSLHSSGQRYTVNIQTSRELGAAVFARRVRGVLCRKCFTSGSFDFSQMNMCPLVIPVDSGNHSPA